MARRPTPLDRVLNPGLAELRQLNDDDLIAFKAKARPDSQEWLLAEQVQRERERWSWPVKLSLGMSTAALIISALSAYFGK